MICIGDTRCNSKLNHFEDDACDQETANNAAPVDLSIFRMFCERSQYICIDIY